MENEIKYKNFLQKGLKINIEIPDFMYKLEIMEQFIKELCVLDDINLEVINITEETIFMNMLNSEIDNISICNNILQGFLNPLLIAYEQEQDFDKTKTLYAILINHATKIYNIPKESVFITNNDEYFTNFTPVLRKIINSRDELVELEIFDKFLNKLIDSGKTLTLKEEIGISQNVDDEQPFDNNLISQCVLVGFLRPLCTAYNENNFDKAKNIYNSMIDYLHKSYCNLEIVSTKQK